MRNKTIDFWKVNILFVLHFIFVFIILFGWIFPSLHFIYISILLGTLLCWIFLGYCPITKWEFNIRKKYEPELNYKNEYLEYYFSKFFKVNIPVMFIRFWGITFLIISLLASIIPYFLSKTL